MDNTEVKGRIQIKRDLKTNWENTENFSEQQLEIKPGELVGVYENFNSGPSSTPIAFSGNLDDVDVIYVYTQHNSTITNNKIEINVAENEELSFQLINKTNYNAKFETEAINIINWEEIPVLAPREKVIINIAAAAGAGAAAQLNITALADVKQYSSISLKIGTGESLTSSDGKGFAETPYVANIKAGEGNGAIAQASLTGIDPVVTGERATGLGYNTRAAGAYSLAGGMNSETASRNSLAYGEGAKTTKQNEIALGKYNSSNEDTVFSVGNGESDTERNNLLELTNEGNLKIQGSLTIDNGLVLNKENLEELIQNGGGGVFVVEFDENNGILTTNTPLTTIIEKLDDGKFIIGKKNDLYYTLISKSGVFMRLDGVNETRIGYIGEQEVTETSISLLQTLPYEADSNYAAAEYANKAYKDDKENIISEVYAKQTDLTDVQQNITDNYLSKTDAENTYAKQTEINNITSNYLSKIDAENTYATITSLESVQEDIDNIAENYLTTADAENTYAKQTDLTNNINNIIDNYLSKADAESTYATPNYVQQYVNEAILGAVEAYY